MTRVKQRLHPASDDPLTLPKSQITFDGALEKYTFQPPVSPALQRDIWRTTNDSPLRASTSKTMKRKADEAIPPSTTKRVTRSTNSTVPIQEVQFPTQQKRKTIVTAAVPKSVSTKSTPASPAIGPATKKRKRLSSGYAPLSKYAHLPNLLTDSLAPSLITVFIGVNPGLTTATTGHAYAHPSNLFYKLLHSSGCTTRRCLPSECKDFPTLFSLGNTNIVSRATRDASELSKEEMVQGVQALQEKATRWKPESVCLVGKSIWEAVWRARKGRAIKKEEFRYGWQDEEENFGINVVRGRTQKVETKDGAWAGARVFVATSTSGLAAGMRPAEKEAVWRELGEWVERRRAERAAESVIEGRLVMDGALDAAVAQDGNGKP
ncbi:hypothetical protein MMC19_003124 [Ptychographa xylographoides]|nr:hypothetical protein [Ptychographa xylographoides]